MMNVISDRRVLNNDPLRQVSGNTARQLKRRKVKVQIVGVAMHTCNPNTPQGSARGLV